MNSKTASLAGIGFGVLIVGLAQLWAAQSANDPTIIGANIGAGMLGLVGFGIIIVSSIFYWQNRKS